MSREEERENSKNFSEDTTRAGCLKQHVRMGLKEKVRRRKVLWVTQRKYEKEK